MKEANLSGIESSGFRGLSPNLLQLLQLILSNSLRVKLNPITFSGTIVYYLLN